MTATVLTDDAGDGVRVITLNRPHRLNAIVPELLEDLIAALEAANRAEAVRAIVLTGAVNIALTSGRPPIPPDTPYRALLVAKIVVVTIMILAAVVNRYVLAPRLKPGARALAVLRATSTAEIALGCVAIAFVSVFALFDPA